MAQVYVFQCLHHQQQCIYLVWQHRLIWDYSYNINYEKKSARSCTVSPQHTMAVSVLTYSWEYAHYSLIRLVKQIPQRSHMLSQQQIISVILSLIILSTYPIFFALLSLPRFQHIAPVWRQCLCSSSCGEGWSSTMACPVQFLCRAVRTVGLVLVYYVFSIGITFYNKWLMKVSLRLAHTPHAT